MKIKDYKCMCGHDDFFFTDKGSQQGIYCSYCGKWLKWADKNEQNLRMKQVSVLDKIRTEIEQIAKDYDKFDDYRRVRGLWIALEIVDKYRTGSEGYGE